MTSPWVVKRGGAEAVEPNRFPAKCPRANTAQNKPAPPSLLDPRSRSNCERGLQCALGVDGGRRENRATGEDCAGNRRHRQKGADAPLEQNGGDVRVISGNVSKAAWPKTDVLFFKFHSVHLIGLVNKVLCTSHLTS